MFWWMRLRMTFVRRRIHAWCDTCIGARRLNERAMTSTRNDVIVYVIVVVTTLSSAVQTRSVFIRLTLPPTLRVTFVLPVSRITCQYFIHSNTWRQNVSQSGTYGSSWKNERISGKDWGVEGAKGVGSGEGCPLPSRLTGLGERRELPQRVAGQSPGRQRIFRTF